MNKSQTGLWCVVTIRERGGKTVSGLSLRSANDSVININELLSRSVPCMSLGIENRKMGIVSTYLVLKINLFYCWFDDELFTRPGNMFS